MLNQEMSKSFSFGPLPPARNHWPDVVHCGKSHFCLHQFCCTQQTVNSVALFCYVAHLLELSFCWPYFSWVWFLWAMLCKLLSYPVQEASWAILIAMVLTGNNRSPVATILSVCFLSQCPDWPGKHADKYPCLPLNVTGLIFPVPGTSSMFLLLNLTLLLGSEDHVLNLSLLPMRIMPRKPVASEPSPFPY